MVVLCVLFGWLVVGKAADNLIIIVTFAQIVCIRVPIQADKPKGHSFKVILTESFRLRICDDWLCWKPPFSKKERK